MRVFIHPDRTSAGAAAAEEIITAFTTRPDGVLGVATGSSPEPLYAALRAAHTAGTFSLAQARAFALDEYVGIPADHEQSYRNVLRRELVGAERTGLTEENLHTPDGLADDPNAAADAHDRAIRDAGGVDLQILGIGSNGHIGFNEPLGSFSSRSHVGELAESTRHDNARFFGNDIDAVPTHCITQGLGTIREARRLVMVADGENKAEAIRQMVEGPVAALCPASILQLHPDVMVFVDEAAASRLEHRDLLAAVAR